MEQLNLSFDFAHETPHGSLRYPGISEDAFQWKSKQRMKKGKVPTDEMRTDTSSVVSTIDETFDTSTLAESASNAPSLSSHSTVNKKGKKRDRHNKKKNTDPLESVHSDVNEIYDGMHDKCEEHSEYTPFATLSCPVCSDPECVLNIAASCPLLRYSEKETAECGLCKENCECSKFKTKLQPVSGLVPRDENGVAETLLKKNGGPIEDSAEWAKRKRWVVPYGISWDHQVDEWITSRMLEASRSTLSGVHRKRSKSKFGKRKSRHMTPTSTPSQVVMNNDNPTQEDKCGESKLLLEGNGFKIVSRGNEKVLINYDKKNCKYLGCSCKKDNQIPNNNCGCDSWREVGHNKKCRKKDKSCKMSKQSGRVSVVKETSHGLVEVTIKELEKTDKEALPCLVDKNDDAETKSDEHKGGKRSESEPLKCDSTQEKYCGKQGHKKGKKVHDDDNDDGAKTIKSGTQSLSGKDLRHASRADVLEEHLRATLGDTYKKKSQQDDKVAVCPAGGCTMYPTPGQAMAEVMMVPVEMLGPCMCSERYSYTSA